MKINVDAGHGSNTAGKRTPPMPYDITVSDKTTIKKGEQFREHIANVGVANFLLTELKRCGFETMFTGFNDINAFDDSDTPLSDRQVAIAKGNCDYSISIHFNAYGDGATFNTAEGVGIYIHDKYINQSDKLAQVILKHLAGGTKQVNRGVTKNALAMCNCNNMDVKGAILVECAFMTNLKEATEMMASEKFWKECAQEICQGICEFTRIKYVSEKSDTYKPAKTITPESSKADVKWLQSRINSVLPDLPGLTPLVIDGEYGPRTRIAVLIYWEQLGWGKHMNDDGRRAGKATREALAESKKV